MSIMQTIFENSNDSDLYLVEHIFNNALDGFCEHAEFDQINSIIEYAELISQGKMDLDLEKKLSNEIAPYLEAYASIYASYLFDELENSESDFDLAKYRERIGKEVVAEAFGQRAKMAATGIGSAIAAALAAVWAVRNKDEIAKYVNTITAKLGPEYNSKVVKYIRNLFGLNDSDTASEKLKKLAAERAEEMKKEIDAGLESTQNMINKNSAAINKGAELAGEAKEKTKKFIDLVSRKLNDIFGEGKYNISIIK